MSFAKSNGIDQNLVLVCMIECALNKGGKAASDRQTDLFKVCLSLDNCTTT